MRGLLGCAFGDIEPAGMGLDAASTIAELSKAVPTIVGAFTNKPGAAAGAGAGGMPQPQPPAQPKGLWEQAKPILPWVAGGLGVALLLRSRKK